MAAARATAEDLAVLFRVLAALVERGDVSGCSFAFRVREGGETWEMRDGEHVRHRMHRWFLAHIKKSGIPYLVVTGTPEERLAAARTAAEEMIRDRRVIT